VTDGRYFIEQSESWCPDYSDGDGNNVRLAEANSLASPETDFEFYGKQLRLTAPAAHLAEVNTGTYTDQLLVPSAAFHFD